MQPDRNAWGHWGQWALQQRRGFRCPHAPSPRWGQLGTKGTRRHRCVICSYKFLRFVPICPHLSPGGGCRKTQCWRGVPIVPSVPIENAQVSTTPLCVRIWLAIQRARVSTSASDVCTCCRDAPVANRSPLACWLTCKASVSHGLHTDREKRARLSPVRSDPQPAIVPPDPRCAWA